MKLIPFEPRTCEGVLPLTVNSSFGQTTGAYRDLQNTNDTGGRILEFVLRINF